MSKIKIFALLATLFLIFLVWPMRQTNIDKISDIKIVSQSIFKNPKNLTLAANKQALNIAYHQRLMAWTCGIENIKEKQYVVDAILACARNMNISSTIEGIETVSMKEIMKNYGATSFQGYLYSKPVEIDEFVKLIQK